MSGIAFRSPLNVDLKLANLFTSFKDFMALSELINFMSFTYRKILNTRNTAKLESDEEIDTTTISKSEIFHLLM